MWSGAFMSWFQTSCSAEFRRCYTKGIVQMKALARSYLWWPGLDRELEELAKACTQCQKEQSSPAVAPLHPWSWLTRPWARIHLDFAGPFQERMFLIAIDAHSKWPEVVEMLTLTATQTVAVLRKMFAANGLPEQVVSDNGPKFVSEDLLASANSMGSNTFVCPHTTAPQMDWQRGSYRPLRLP